MNKAAARAAQRSFPFIEANKGNSIPTNLAQEREQRPQRCLHRLAAKRSGALRLPYGLNRRDGALHRLLRWLLRWLAAEFAASAASVSVNKAARRNVHLCTGPCRGRMPSCSADGRGGSGGSSRGRGCSTAAAAAAGTCAAGSCGRGSARAQRVLDVLQLEHLLHGGGRPGATLGAAAGRADGQRAQKVGLLRSR